MPCNVTTSGSYLKEIKAMGRNDDAIMGRVSKLSSAVGLIGARQRTQRLLEYLEDQLVKAERTTYQFIRVLMNVFMLSLWLPNRYSFSICITVFSTHLFVRQI